VLIGASYLIVKAQLWDMLILQFIAKLFEQQITYNEIYRTSCNGAAEAEINKEPKTINLFTGH